MRARRTQDTISVPGDFEVRALTGSARFAGPALLSVHEHALAVEQDGELAGLFSAPWQVTLVPS